MHENKFEFYYWNDISSILIMYVCYFPKCIHRSANSELVIRKIKIIFTVQGTLICLPIVLVWRKGLSLIEYVII